MNEDKNEICFNVLLKVYRDNAYASIELDKVLKYLSKESNDDNAAYITKLFYGVIEKSTQFDYIISDIVDKQPKLPVKILIKMGLYQLKYMNVPSYAAINNIVNLTKKIGKAGVSGFINAVLRKVEKYETAFKSDTLEYLSFTYSVPMWLTKLIVNDYGYEFTKNFLNYDLPTQAHIRVNLNNISRTEFELKYPFLDEYKSKYGYYATRNMIKLMDNKDYIIQSLSSMIATKSYCEVLTLAKEQGLNQCELKNCKQFKTNNIFPTSKMDDLKLDILDLCSAPGGKAIYLKELFPNSSVFACDIHPHRVELIKKYAKFVGSDIFVQLNDAIVLNNNWINEFDLVLCDVPCSGIGVIKSKPDILLNRQENDIIDIVSLQTKIINTAANYVKKDGFLCYSTCTILKVENENMIEKFLINNKNFIKIDSLPDIKLFPQIDNCDGFYIARLKKIF